MSKTSSARYRLCLVTGAAAVFSLITIVIAHAMTSFAVNAVDGLGQYDGTSMTDPVPAYTRSNANDAPSRLGLSEGSVPVGAVIDTTNHRLFVADSGNNRVLVYTLTSGNAINSRIPTYVLGQADFVSNSAATTSTGMNTPTSLTMDNTRSLLFVSDSGNNRVLVFDVSTVSSGMAATYVLGQSGFTTATAATTQAGLSTPYGLAYDTTRNRLYVADSANKRILVFSGASLASGMNSSYVLGQSTFTTATTGTTRSTLAASPAGVAFDPNLSNVYVADTGNNRILVFSGAALVNGMDANKVLGQTTFTAATAATTQAGLSAPNGLSFDSTNNRLFVADTTNRRVLAYSGAALSTGMNANTVIGQANFTASAAATTQAGLSSPRNVFFDTSSNKLFVADVGNHRFTVYGTALSNGMSASDALGQYDATSADPQPIYTKGNANNGVNQYGFNNPNDVLVDTTNHRLFVSDGSNNRVLVYNLSSSDLLLDRIPDYVLGQPNLYSNTAATTQVGMSNPFGLAFDAARNRIYVGDVGNRRVLVFSGASLSNGMTANTVIGQSNFTSSAGNFSPRYITYDPGHDRLFVSSNIVYVYDTSALANGMSASNTIGVQQQTGSGFFASTGVAYDTVHDRLFVGDQGYGRVLIFSGATITAGMEPINVLGKPNFTTYTSTSTQSTMGDFIGGLAYDAVHDRLFVMEYFARRIMVFDTAKVSNGMNASFVFGQPDFTTQNTSVTQSAVRSGHGLELDPTNYRLYAVSNLIHRVLAFDVLPDTPVLSISSSAATSLTLSLTDRYRDTTIAVDTVTVTVANPTGDSETVVLTETATGSGLFSGALNVSPGGAAVPNDGMLQVAAGSSYAASVTYEPLTGSDIIDTDTFTAPTAAAAAAQAASGGGGGGGRGRGSTTVPTAPSPSTEPSAPSSGDSDDSDSPSTSVGAVNFTDVPATSWFSSFVIKLSELGIISGYRDSAGNLTGSFGPANLVTRAEMLKMALLSSGQTALTSEPTNASAKGTWVSGYVAQAEALNLSVFLRSTVDVHTSATRGEVIQTILEVFGTELTTSPSTFSDVPTNHLNAATIATAQQLGIISGDTDASGMPTGTFRPNDAVNRAETAKMVVRAMEVLR